MGGDNTSLELVNGLSEALLETPSFALAAEHLRRDPACAALIEERWIPPAHNLVELAALPEGSLGQVYATALAELGYDPNLHAGMEPENDAVYVELRLGQAHGLWHMITGFDTPLLGEIALQAFHLAQFPYPLASTLTAQALLATTLLQPDQLPAPVGAIHSGLAMGREARPPFAQRWGEGWAKPLLQWRGKLQLWPRICPQHQPHRGAGSRLPKPPPRRPGDAQPTHVCPTDPGTGRRRRRALECARRGRRKAMAPADGMTRRNQATHRSVALTALLGMRGLYLLGYAWARAFALHAVET